MLEVTLRPHGKLGMFDALLGDRVLCRSKRPFHDAARVLVAEGHCGSTPYATRHEGSTHQAMREPLGVAAAFTVYESDRTGLKRVKWQPFPGRGEGDAA